MTSTDTDSFDPIIHGTFWTASTVTHGDTPPSGKIASYTDRQSYTVHIDGMTDPDELAGRVVSLPRYGAMWITDPEGNTIRSGYWMNWPEDEWNLSEQAWAELSWEQRATLEVKQQATAYRPLENQFTWHLGHYLIPVIDTLLVPILKIRRDPRIIDAFLMVLGNREFTLEDIYTGIERNTDDASSDDASDQTTDTIAIDPMLLATLIDGCEKAIDSSAGDYANTLRTAVKAAREWIDPHPPTTESGREIPTP